MTEKQIDARGLGCSQPVILARQALLSAGAGTVRVLVDDMVSVANIQRMTATLGWRAEVSPADQGTCLDYYKLKDVLEVGAVSNMFEIASVLVEADRVVRP